MDKQLIEKMVRELLTAYGLVVKKNLPKKMITNDLIDINISLVSSVMANILNLLQKEFGNRIDMDKTIDRLNASLKFHFSEKN